MKYIYLAHAYYIRVYNTTTHPEKSATHVKGRQSSSQHVRIQLINAAINLAR